VARQSPALSEKPVTTNAANSDAVQPSACAVCSPDETSVPAAGIAEMPCPRCGHLIWFTREGIANDPIIKPTVRMLEPKMVEKLIDLATHFRGKRLVVDFREVDLMPSASLGKLVRLNKTVAAAGGRLVLTNLSSNLFNVFQITGLDRVLDIEA
jgi:anti-anti-sigma factor